MSNATTRWHFEHVESGDEATLPFNPDTSSSREMAAKALSHSLAAGDGRARTMKGAPRPVEWTFSGPIRTQAHHELLESWAKRSGVVRITDHMGQVYDVMLQSYLPEDRKPSPRTPWRMKYSMKCLILRRVA